MRLAEKILQDVRVLGAASGCDLLCPAGGFPSPLQGSLPDCLERAACSLSCVRTVSAYCHQDSQNAICCLLSSRGTARAGAGLSLGSGLCIQSPTSCLRSIHPSCAASVSPSANRELENSTAPGCKKIKQCVQGTGPDRSLQQALASRCCLCLTSAWHGDYVTDGAQESGTTSVQHPSWGWQNGSAGKGACCQTW